MRCDHCLLKVEKGSQNLGCGLLCCAVQHAFDLPLLDISCSLIKMCYYTWQYVYSDEGEEEEGGVDISGKLNTFCLCLKSVSHFHSGPIALII